MASGPIRQMSELSPSVKVVRSYNYNELTMKSVLPLLFLLLLGMPAQASYNDLRVLTHNVYLPVFLRGLGTGPGTDQRAALVAQADYIRGYDVVALNELFELNYDGSGPANVILQGLANDYPYQTPVIASDLNASQWDDSIGHIDPVKKNGGVAILSRWPIEYQAQVMFNNSCGDDSLDNKGFAYARILRNGERLHLIATHTQSESSSCGGTPKGSAERLAQFGKIRDFVAAQNIPAHEPVIIAGDLNVKTQGPEYQNMLSALNARAPQYLNDIPSWNPEQNDLAAKQYPGYAPEHLDYLLLSAAHADIPGWGNATLPVAAASTWRDTVIIPDSYHYESDEYSDHFPVVGLGAAASQPDISPRQERYRQVRFKALNSGGYLGLSNNSDGWLTTNHSASDASSSFRIEGWGTQFTDLYCLTSNNYKDVGGWPGAYIKLRSNQNGRYMNYWRGGDGDYGYYAATSPSENLYLRKVGPVSDGCLKDGDEVVFGDFGGSFWYYVRNWQGGNWHNHLFLWDRSYGNDHRFRVEID